MFPFFTSYVPRIYQKPSREVQEYYLRNKRIYLEKIRNVSENSESKKKEANDRKWALILRSLVRKENALTTVQY